MGLAKRTVSFVRIAEWFVSDYGTIFRLVQCGSEKRRDKTKAPAERLRRDFRLENQSRSYTLRTRRPSVRPRSTRTRFSPGFISKKLSESSRSGSSLSMDTNLAYALAVTVISSPAAAAVSPGSANSKCLGAQNRAVPSLTVSPPERNAKLR